MYKFKSQSWSEQARNLGNANYLNYVDKILRGKPTMVVPTTVGEFITTGQHEKVVSTEDFYLYKIGISDRDFLVRERAIKRYGRLVRDFKRKHSELF